MIQKRKSEVLSKAARPVVESMEQRQLLSATLSVNTALMVFNAVQNSSASQIETLTLTNTGDAALTLGVGSTTLAPDPSISSADQSHFALINGASVPASLAPGASFGLQVDYQATAVTTNFAILDIASNDPATPTAQVHLHGIGTKGLGGSNQPSLATILQAYNIPTLVGDGPNDANALQDNTYPYPPDPTTQEVNLQRLVKAGTGPVTINVLASFTASGTHPYTLGTYTPGNPTGLNELFTTPSSDYQSVYVQPQGTTTFDPGTGQFGFYFISNVQVKGRVGYTEDALNTWDSTTGRHFRFFPMETSAGAVVPNQYIMTSTEWNAPVGYDFTNIVAIISNVKAAPGAPDGPVMGLQNLNALPGEKNMIFNEISSPNTSLGDIVHNTGTLQVNNTGDQPLILSSYTLSPAWTLVSPPTFPVTVAAGGNLDLSIKFIATAQPTVPYNETNGSANGGGGGVYNGALTLTGNDPNTPTATIPLAGWRQLHSENENEPGLQTIVNLLEGWGTNINPKPIPDLTESANTSGSAPTYYGEEVVSGYWMEADPSLSVGVTQLAAYHTEGASTLTYWYTKGSSSYSKLYTTATDAGQTLLPYAINTTTPAAGSFTSSGIFGFRVDNEYSDDAKNTTLMTGGGHHFRFYPVRDSTGKLVPNTYIMAMDYSNTPQNFDFQDNIYIVSNIRPYQSTPTPTDLYATNATTGNLLQWSSVQDSTLAGYNVYRAASYAGPYTLLTATPTTAIAYTDLAAPATGTSYYKVTAVDSGSLSESVGNTAFIANAASSSGGGGGGGGTTPTGTPIASAESINTLAGNPVTVTELIDATDATGTLVPSSVVVTSGPNHGTTSINSSNGAITYSPAAGYTGTDTFQYTVSDSTGATSAAATVTVNVSAVPIGNPVAANLAETTAENTVVTFNVTSSATDTSATIVPSTLTITRTPAHGKAVVDPTTGNITYTPASGYTGADTLQYTVGDTLSAVSAAATVTFNIAASGPVAATITAPPITGDGPVTINVLAASTDGTGTLTPSSVIITTQPINGVASVNPTTGAITYTPNVDSVGTDTLQYTVGDAHTVSAPATLSISVGANIDNVTANSVVFYDNGGSKVTVSLAGLGSGQVFFSGTGTTQLVRRSMVISGNGLAISSIVLTGTTRATSLTIGRKGFSATTLGGLTVTGSMNRIFAPTSTLTGTLSVSGSLNLLQLSSAVGATINVGPGTARPVLTFVAGHVTNTNLNSAAPIKTIKVTDWVNTGTVDAVAAPSISTLLTTGAFDATLTLSGGTPYTLGSSHIGGQIAADSWSVTGATNSFYAGSIAAGWTGNFGNINNFTVKSGGFAGTLTAATMNGLTVIGDDTGNITAASIRSAKIAGQLNEATITLTNPVAPRALTLGRLIVTGNTTGSAITSAGSIGSISTLSISSSAIDAGVAAGVALPTTASQLTANASIGSVSVVGRGATFADTRIGASSVGSLSLGEILTSSSEGSFGIGAATIKSLSATLDTGGKLRLGGLQLATSNSIATYVSTNNLTLNSFVIHPGL